MFALKHGQLVLRDKVMFVLSFFLFCFKFVLVPPALIEYFGFVHACIKRFKHHTLFMLRLIYHNLKYHTLKNHIKTLPYYMTKLYITHYVLRTLIP